MPLTQPLVNLFPQLIHQFNQIDKLRGAGRPNPVILDDVSFVPAGIEKIGVHFPARAQNQRERLNRPVVLEVLPAHTAVPKADQTSPGPISVPSLRIPT